MKNERSETVNEESQINYYAIIPATVRYDKELKPAEKLLYGEITSLTNQMGYCYASNKYFSKLYNVTIHTVSQWVSHLEKLGYIQMELIKDSNNAIKERRLYIIDTPYVQKSTYPYVLKNTYPMYKKVQENNKYIIDDDIFNLIIKNDNKIPSDFYKILNQLDFVYSENLLSIMKPENITMIKNIIQTLYDLYNSRFSNIISCFTRETLINLYILSLEKEPNNILNYYKRAIINKYTNNST